MEWDTGLTLGKTKINKTRKQKVLAHWGKILVGGK